MKRIAITFLTMITLAGSVFAQVPRGFNYQMVVRNTNGQLVSESIVRLVLSIRQGTPTGPVVYQLTDTPQTNTNGLVTLVVGTGSDSASYDAINWANGPYFLVCEVDPTGGSNYALRTEQQILSVPYAAYATTADRVSQSFTYNEQDPKFSNWGYDYDSLVGAPARLSEFINDLPQVTSLPWDSISGHPTALSQFTNDLPQVTSLPWDSISGHPTALSQFTNDLPQVTSLPWDSISGHPTALSQFTNDLPQVTSLPWDSITGHPTNLSQFANDLSFLTASDLLLTVSGNTLCVNGLSCVTLPQTTSIQWDSVINHPTTILWDSITGHPTSLSDLTNDLTLRISGDTLFVGSNWILLPGNSGFTVNWADIPDRPTSLSQFINDLPQVTSLPWDSITGHPTALSQFTNDLPQVTSLPWDSITGHPTALSQFTNDLPQVTSLPWDSITGRPTSLSQLINDGGYLTAETQTLADVMALGNDANGLVITNLGDPTSPYDVANKHYVDDAMATERIILNNRIDSLRSALDSLRVAYDSLRNSQGSSIDSVSTNLYDYQHRLVAGELEGVFSVGTSKQVRFSSGNLQYRPRTKTWRFALSQNGYIGTENNYISNPYYADWIDLFGYGTSGWSSGATTLGNPTSTSTNDVEYTESTDGDDLTGMYANADWGFYNPIINGGNQMGTWRTMTHSEWIYLLNDRPNASSLRGLATVGSKSGYIILPDNWTLPATESFDPTATNYITNNYDDDHWAIMEAAGAVFLPSAGYRTASTTTQNGVEGHYWTSTHVNGTLSNSIKIAIPTGATSDPANSSKGYSVRLVRDY